MALSIVLEPITLLLFGKRDANNQFNMGLASLVSTGKFGPWTRILEANLVLDMS